MSEIAWIRNTNLHNHVPTLFSSGLEDLILDTSDFSEDRL